MKMMLKKKKYSRARSPFFRNYLPLAKTGGARIFTQVSFFTSDSPWLSDI